MINILLTECMCCEYEHYTLENNISDCSDIMSRNFLTSGDELRKGDFLMSNNKQYKAVFQVRAVKTSNLKME